jgi:flagellar assembly protein FliH
LDSGIAVAAVRHALLRSASAETVRIRVHAADLESVKAHREELLTLVDGIRQLEIVADRRVGPGGCVVETLGGVVDARVETQLDEVESALRACREEAA